MATTAKTRSGDLSSDLNLDLNYGTASCHTAGFQVTMNQTFIGSNSSSLVYRLKPTQDILCICDNDMKRFVKILPGHLIQRRYQIILPEKKL